MNGCRILRGWSLPWAISTGLCRSVGLFNINLTRFTHEISSKRTEKEGCNTAVAEHLHLNKQIPSGVCFNKNLISKHCIAYRRPFCESCVNIAEICIVFARVQIPPWPRPSAAPQVQQSSVHCSLIRSWVSGYL